MRTTVLSKSISKVLHFQIQAFLLLPTCLSLLEQEKQASHSSQTNLKRVHYSRVEIPLRPQRNNSGRRLSELKSRNIVGWLITDIQVTNLAHVLPIQLCVRIMK